MPEQFAVTACHQAARVGDQPERVPPLARAFPGHAKQGAMARKDDAEGDVARACSCVQRIVDREQLDEPGPPISGRRGRVIESEPEPARHSIEAGSSGEPDRSALIAQNDEAVGAVRRCSTQAQAKPCRVLSGNKMVFVAAALVRQRLKAGWQRDRGDVDGLNDHHVGCGLGRPQRRTGAWIGIRRGGESSAPIVRPDPPLRFEQWPGPGRSCPSSRHDPGDRRGCVAGTPAQNPHSHDLDTDLRPLLTAKKYPRT